MRFDHVYLVFIALLVIGGGGGMLFALWHFALVKLRGPSRRQLLWICLLLTGMMTVSWYWTFRLIQVAWNGG